MWSGTVSRLLIISACLAVAWSIPTSLVDEIKSNELRENKVKRSSTGEENTNVQYYNKPSASKRGGSLKNPNAEQQVLNEWSQLQADSLPNLQSGLFSQQQQPQGLYDDKTLAEYEKGFQYGVNKDKLDEALENAVLKSEFYEPGSLNQYRYYGADDRKRRRRAVKKFRLNPRLKREVELTPEEILAILNFYEKSRQPESSYRKWLGRLEAQDNENFEDVGGVNNNEENWLDNPVYPHMQQQDSGPQYLVDDNSYEKRSGRWGSFADGKKKRFMVAKKRNDPTRELRYLNGPNQNDYYALSQMLNNQRDPDVPLYQRLIL